MTENITTTKGAATPENISQNSVFCRVSAEDSDYREIRVIKKEVAVLWVAGAEGDGMEITLEKEELALLGNECLALAERM